MTTTKKTSKAQVKLPPNPFIFEILDLVSTQRSKAKKIEILQEYRDPSLVSVLIWNFDETVVSVIPEGEVPYNPNVSEENFKNCHK